MRLARLHQSAAIHAERAQRRDPGSDAFPMGDRSARRQDRGVGLASHRRRSRPFDCVAIAGRRPSTAARRTSSLTPRVIPFATSPGVFHQCAH